MTITNEEIVAVAPLVTPAKAQEVEGYQNPFISFQSLESLCQGNETLEYCLKEVAIYSLRYAETVCRFEQIVAKSKEQGCSATEDRKEIDSLRKLVHDSTISAVKALARVLTQAGKDSGWFSKMNAGGRPEFSKFALLIAFEIVLRKAK